MFGVLVRYLLINAAGILVSCAILFLFPRESGFTVTTPNSTHYFGGGVYLSAIVMCLVDLAIGIGIAWSLLHPR